LTDFELNWQPPLSIFKVDTAIPCCKGELVLNPQTSATFQKAAIESLGADKVAGVDLPASQSALANPPPATVLSNCTNCVDNYNHYTNSGFPSRN
jgi:hypothetical protein